jgi:hypothetical protein
VKVKVYYVCFTRQIEVNVVVPEGASDQEVEEAANKTMGSLDEWDVPEWEANVGTSRVVDVLDEDRRPFSKKGLFSEDDVMVISSDRGYAFGEFVAPDDSRWWVLNEGEEESRPELPDNASLDLFGGLRKLRDDVIRYEREEEEEGGEE